METFIKPLPLASTADDLRSGRPDLMAYIDKACERLSQVDPYVKAMLPEKKRRERLRREAIELQGRFPDPQNRPPLYGALAAIKDIFHVDGFDTRAGSDLPPDLLRGPEALCVRLLRDAGALILGKSVTTEFAYLEPGPTRNPHNPGHTPGGSSSGSAAAVAAGICPMATGTQTIGSTIRPAAYCGIVGFKPSAYRIPTGGLIHFSRTADQIGLFTQDLAGMAMACSILCQSWREVDVLNRLPTLGVPVGPYLDQADEDGLKAFERQLRQLNKKGVKIRELRILDNIEEINLLHKRMVCGEFAREHRGLISEFAHRFGLETVEAVKIGRTVDDKELSEARSHGSRLRSDLELKMASEGIELWACPAARGPAPSGLGNTGDPAMNLPWTHAGMPAITLPFGQTDTNLPLGFQVISASGMDEYLLAWSRQLISTQTTL